MLSDIPMGGDDYFISTKCSSGRINAGQHEVVTFQERKKKGGVNREEKESVKDQRKEIDMKRARFEVYKFAQSALKPADKHQSNVELAIRLGAKPPKNKGVNYKELIIMKKSAMNQAKEQKFIAGLGKQFSAKKRKETKKQALSRKKRTGDGILNVYGKAKVHMLKK